MCIIENMVEVCIDSIVLKIISEDVNTAKYNWNYT